MLSNRTFDVSRPTDSSQLFSEKENKNQDYAANKLKTIGNLIYHGEASVRHTLRRRERQARRRIRRRKQFRYKD